MEPRPPQMEPLLSIKRLTIKDIEKEQQRLKVNAPTAPKPRPRPKEPEPSKTTETSKSTGYLKVPTHSLIKRKKVLLL